LWQARREGGADFYGSPGRWTDADLSSEATAMSEPAAERVAATCPYSKYKDDRHEWRTLMAQECITYHPRIVYELRECQQCKLIVLLQSFGGSAYNDPPKKTDRIIYAFYEATSEDH
jgi:hypothetical protein